MSVDEIEDLAWEGDELYHYERKCATVKEDLRRFRRSPPICDRAEALDDVSVELIREVNVEEVDRCMILLDQARRPGLS